MIRPMIPRKIPPIAKPMTPKIRGGNTRQKKVHTTKVIIKFPSLLHPTTTSADEDQTASIMCAFHASIPPSVFSKPSQLLLLS